METRANHLLIGSFVLLFIAGIFAFVIWLTKLQVDREYAYFDVLFSDEVSGLGEGGDVRFNGIKVGSVERIVIDRNNPSLVKVTLAVDAETPVRQNSSALLELQGITGVSFVQISGGTADSPLVEGSRSRSGEHPVIQARPSKFAELFQAAPELLAKTVQLVERANALLGPENERNIAGILSDIRSLSTTLARREQAIVRVIDAMDKSAGDVAATIRSIRTMIDDVRRVTDEAERTLVAARGTMQTVDGIVAKDVQPLLVEGRKTAASIGKLTDQLNDVLAENRQPLHQFATEGVGEVRQFINDARVLVDTLSRVASRLEEDPSRLLFGTKESEFKAEGK
jgi:phospholipid/cholesterol/gamma-HCH transport system substrate-binding protein